MGWHGNIKEITVPALGNIEIVDDGIYIPTQGMPVEVIWASSRDEIETFLNTMIKWAKESLVEVKEKVPADYKSDFLEKLKEAEDRKKKKRRHRRGIRSA